MLNLYINSIVLKNKKWDISQSERKIYRKMPIGHKRALQMYTYHTHTHTWVLAHLNITAYKYHLLHVFVMFPSFQPPLLLLFTSLKALTLDRLLRIHSYFSRQILKLNFVSENSIVFSLFENRFTFSKFKFHIHQFFNAFFIKSCHPLL